MYSVAVLVLPAKRRFLIVGVICLAGFVNRAFAKTPALAPHVDERVELLSVIFRLAGNGEYNMNKLPAYSADIDHVFAPFKGHPAVQMAHALAEKGDGVGFDAVMSMAVSLSPPPELKPLVAFTATVPDERWGIGAQKFLPLLRDFYRYSKFAEFYAAHQAMSNSQTIRTIAWAADVRQDRTLPENGTAANRGRQKLRFQTLHIAELGTFRRLTLPEIPSSLLLMCPTYSLLDIRRSDSVLCCLAIIEF